MNRGRIILTIIGLVALLMGTWSFLDQSLRPSGKVSLEFVGSRSMSAERQDQPKQEVSFLVHNNSSRAARVVFTYAQINEGTGWVLDRSGPLGPEQDWGEIPGRAVKPVRFPLTECRLPWRVHVMAYERASLPKRAELAIKRMWARLRLGADAGRGPQLVEDRYLEGFDIVSESIYPGAEPDGAANRSQPVCSQTNRTSAAAGSGG